MIDKKELKRQYKETIQPMGIYIIKNVPEDKVFIGTSKNLPGKLNSSKFQLRNGSHMNRALQDDFTRLGESNFSFEILDQLKPKDEPAYDYTEDLEVLEELWLEKLQPYDERGYNKRKAKSGK